MIKHLFQPTLSMFDQAYIVLGGLYLPLWVYLVGIIPWFYMSSRFEGYYGWKAVSDR